MIIESKYRSTPLYGIISIDKKKFNDCDLFKGDMWKYAVLKKIQIWWGTPLKNENLPKMKTLIGIKCSYKNIMTGEEKVIAHCGNISGNDIDVKEISVEKGDYFNQFHIGFDTNISYIKFSTKDNKQIEYGERIDGEYKTINLNYETEPNMVQCLIGYYNENRISALGCKYIKKKYYIFLNLMDIFRLRHLFKYNEEIKKKWSDKNQLDKCNLIIKALAKLCLLPDAQFYSIIKYFA